MNRAGAWVLLVVLLALGAAGGAALARRFEPQPVAPLTAQALQSAFNRAAEIGTRSVVHITTKREGNAESSGEDVGSGVIVTADGHVVTNNHVVRQVKSVQVRFVDGVELPAVVVGADPESDLAVLKIETGGRTLVPIAFADSDKVRVGDLVFAIGSPYGYNHTVTNGIVSAKHRRVEFGQPFEDFVQTNAEINPGNSGGALVNLEGELVGLNAAMVSTSRGNEGIGLAIASNLVKWVQERLIRDGKVRRGYLGIVPVDLNPKAVERSLVGGHRRFAGVKDSADLLAELGVPDGKGVLIAHVEPNTPAASAPLVVLDVITGIDGRPVRSKHELFFRISDLDPGRKVQVTFVRDRKPATAEVTLVERPPVDAWGRRPRE